MMFALTLLDFVDKHSEGLASLGVACLVAGVLALMVWADARGFRGIR